MGKRCNDCGGELHKHQEGVQVWFACQHCTKIFGADFDLKNLEFTPTTYWVKDKIETQLC